MRDKKKTKNQLIKELSNLRRQLTQSKASQTKHRRILKTLKESERKLETIMKNINDIIFQVSPSGIIKYVSPNVKKLYGYEPKELTGQHLKKTTPKSDVHKALEALKRISSGETIKNLKINQLDSKGKIIPVEINLVPVKRKSKIIAVQGVMRDISERKRAAKKVWRAEKRLGDIANNTLTWIWEINTKGKYMYASPAVRKILGYAPEDVLKKHFHDFFHPQDKSDLKKIAFKLIAKKQPFREFLNRNINKNGKTVWLSTSGVPMFDEKGKLLGYRGADVDITERKRTEEALRESEEKYRTTFELAPDGIVTVDMKGIVTSCNTAFYNMTGYSEDEIIGKHFSKLPSMRLEDVPRYMKWFKTLVKNKRLPSFEFMWVRKDGVIHYAEIHSSYMKKGAKTVGYQAIVRDVTERKQAAEALRESEEKYKTLTDNVNVGIYRNTVGSKGKFIEANPAIIKMFGYKNKEEFFKTDVADLYQNSKGRKKFNKKMLIYGFVKDEELQLKKKNGTLFIGSISAVAVRNTKGEVIYYDGIIEDITERKQAEKKLMSGYKRLQKTLRGTVDTLALAAAKRDPYTADHQHRVALLVCAIAKELGFSADQIEGLRLAAIIHDVGKIHVPAEILNKPSALTEFEFNFIRTHPQVGYDILWKVDFPWPIAKIVLQHHERLNGSGYPQGLKGKDFILEARILAVADVVEAMTAHRPYRPAHSLKKTLEEIHKNRGILYEPRVVDICLNLFRKKHFKFKGNEKSG